MKILLNGKNGYFWIKVAGYPLDSRSAILQCAHFRPEPEISGAGVARIRFGSSNRSWSTSAGSF